MVLIIRDNMNKLVRIIIPIVVAIAIVIGGYYFIYLPNYNDIVIGISTPVEDDGQYLEDFIIHYSHMPENKIPLVEELTNTKNDFRMNFFNEHKEDNYHIEIEFAFEKGQTIVTYTGTITDKETGIEEPFEKEFVHDFILTKDVQ